MSKGLKITLISLGVIGTGVGLYFLFRDKDKDESKKNGNGDDDIISKLNPFTSNKYKSDSFPLKKDSGGSRVKKLQEYLNTKYNAGLDTDGKFGPLTEGALKTHTGLTQVDETWYNTNVLATASSGNGNGNGNGNENNNSASNFQLNLQANPDFNPYYAQNLIEPMAVDNVYVDTPIIPNYYGFEGSSRNWTDQQTGVGDTESLTDFIEAVP